MAQLPTIYTIQASDAPQHTGKLQTILQNLQSQNRIRSFVNTEADSDLSSITDVIKEGDLILIVLTHQLDSQKEQIEAEFKALKAERPEIRVGEIIVDKVAYENEFITFPSDLRDIRSREDMDEAWGSIEQSLKGMFPVKEEPEPVPPPPVNWPKYLKIAGIVVGIILVLFLIKMWSDGDEPTAEREPAVVEEQAEEQAEAEEQTEIAALRDEDCLSFNPGNVRVQADGNRFLLTDGRSRMMLFRTREGANMALRVIRNYGLDSHCFAIRPNAGLRYFKVQRDLPSGSMNGEDCIRINNPQNLTIRESSGTLFQIIDGRNVPFSAKSREEAERIVEIVEHYNPSFTCYVERPDPGMVYLRR